MTAPTKAPLRRISDEPLREIREAGSDDHEKLETWFRELEQWGMKVRDDILRLEDAVIDLAKHTKLDGLQFGRAGREFEERPKKPQSTGPAKRYIQKYPEGHGDPGDPPHGPW